MLPKFAQAKKLTGWHCKKEEYFRTSLVGEQLLCPTDREPSRQHCNRALSEWPARRDDSLCADHDRLSRKTRSCLLLRSPLGEYCIVNLRFHLTDDLTSISRLVPFLLPSFKVEAWPSHSTTCNR